jgi:hypothetical protein
MYFNNLKLIKTSNLPDQNVKMTMVIPVLQKKGIKQVISNQIYTPTGCTCSYSYSTTSWFQSVFQQTINIYLSSCV